ncbi:DUF4349 domain-containing protein [Pelotomaculum isophthalicicum JI]|uniref:Anti-sigma-W factor RsiW n=1 Tax=Pelotomaculum isophthalicicum JI TaxID=947010 RepID=A0A9X4GZS8_9FIRM|nr:DUF4349 domain-containing protein [Pelotomaculum isophthalicicum]MDF9409110.1 DUF4349 domain-containing protein [Pelotomaculum isophthalicicum JI]
MQCLEIEELLSPYLDEVLDPSESEVVASHLAVCASCREKYDILNETVNFIKNLPEMASPPEFGTQVINEVLTYPAREKTGLGSVFKTFKKSGWLRACSFAAMFVVIFSITTLIYGMPPGQWYQKISSLLVYEQRNEPKPDAEIKSNERVDINETDPKEDGPGYEDKLDNIPGLPANDGSSPAGIPVVPQKMAEKEGAIITEVAYGYIPASNKEPHNLLLDATLALSTENPSVVPEKIADLADKNGGYLAPGSSEEGTLTVKVPADRFDNVLSSIREMGNTDTRRIAGEDVSEKISGYENNIRYLANEKQMSLKAIENAGSSAETQAAQAQLDKVQTDMEQQKKLYSKLLNDTHVATIKVNLQ